MTDKSLHAILIDPTSRTVEPVELNRGYREISRILGCGCFTTLGLSRSEVLYLDDEGLLKEEPGPFFKLEGYPQPLAGRGLILGLDFDGESVSTKLTVEKVRQKVSWPEVKFVGFADSSGTEDHPLLGSVHVFRRVAKFTPLAKGDK